MLGVRLITFCLVGALICGIAGIVGDPSRALAVVVTVLSGGAGVLWLLLPADLLGC